LQRAGAAIAVLPVSGRFSFEWHDDSGAIYRDSASIEVS